MICPCCGGDPVRLGMLGALDHFTCRQCGAQWHRAAPAPKDEFDQYLNELPADWAAEFDNRENDDE